MMAEPDPQDIRCRQRRVVSGAANSPKRSTEEYIASQYGRPCSSCGVTNADCLRSVLGREGRACCTPCHRTDTHDTEAAEREAKRVTYPDRWINVRQLGVGGCDHSYRLDADETAAKFPADNRRIAVIHLAADGTLTLYPCDERASGVS